MRRFGLVSDKIVVLLVAVTMIILVMIHTVVDRSTEQLKSDEIAKSKAYAAHIAKLIIDKTGGRIEARLADDPLLQVSLQTTLEALLTSQYEYLFVIKRQKPRMYRFLLDGSRDAKENFGAVFIPMSDVYDEVYDAKQARIVKQEDEIKRVWLSLLYPIVVNGRTEAMIVLDLADWYGSHLEHFNSPVSRILTLMEWVFGIALSLLIVLSWYYHRSRKRLFIDEVSGAHTKAYLFDYIGDRSLDRFHAAIVDIDELKEINRLYGYETGNALLREFVTFSRWNLPAQTQLVHLGGSEFFLLIPNQVKLEDFVSNFYNTLRHELFQIGKYEINLSLSMSAMTIPPHTTSLQYVLHVLYETLMEIKKRGKGHYKIVDIKDKQELYFRQIDYIRDLLFKKSVRLSYQPIYDIKKEQVVKYEALVRLYDQENDMTITPDLFLDVIRGTSLYVTLSRLVFEEVFALLQQHPSLHLSVNISLDDLFNHETMMLIDRFLQRHSDEAKRLTFEILESSPIMSYADINAVFKTIRRHGAKIAIDDFGSRYADFQHLANLKADFVKIDGSLIRKLTDDDKVAIVVQTIVDVAHRFGMDVIAEYIADEELFTKVKALGFDYAQGYYIGKPDRISREET